MRVRRKKTADEIYSDLNRPSTIKVRKATERTVKSMRLNPPATSDTMPFSNILQKTPNVDQIINSNRRTNTDIVQRWIDEFNPGPFDIMRKIANISQPHQKILTYIADELQKLVLKPRPPSAVNKRRTELSKMRLEINSVDALIDEEHDRQDILKSRLKELIAQKEALENHLSVINRTIHSQTFDKSRERTARMQEEAAEAANETAERMKRKRASRMNELGGENRHLRDELEKVTELLKEQRVLHNKYAEYRATLAIQSRQIQNVDLM